MPDDPDSGLAVAWPILDGTASTVSVSILGVLRLFWSAAPYFAMRNIAAHP